MDQINTKKLWNEIISAGNYLKGKLPNHPNHPKGRNPYAHVAICVKSKFGSSYKDLPDNDFQKVVEPNLKEFTNIELTCGKSKVKILKPEWI